MTKDETYNAILEFAMENNTAPYGVLESKGITLNGKHYRQLTFGRARTLDCTVKVYGPRFITLLSSRNTYGSEVYQSTEEVLNRLKEWM